MNIENITVTAHATRNGQICDYSVTASGTPTRAELASLKKLAVSQATAIVAELDNANTRTNTMTIPAHAKSYTPPTARTIVANPPTSSEVPPHTGTITDKQYYCLNGLRKGKYYSGSEEDIGALSFAEAKDIISKGLEKQNLAKLVKLETEESTAYIEKNPSEFKDATKSIDFSKLNNISDIFDGE